MRQDEAGRWVSDDGRYLWNGTEWLDLGTPGAPGSPAASRSTAPTTSSPDAPPGPARRDAAPPGSAGPGAPGHRRPRRRRRPYVLLAVLLVLVVLGVGSVLLFGRDPATRPTATPSSAVPDGPPPDAVASPSATPAVLDAQQRRARAEGALLTRADVPGITEERRSNPTDVFLPCRAPALLPPEGSVLVGTTLSNTDFTTYAGETIVGYPTARGAADAIAALKSGVSRCAPYDYQYVGSPRVDRITHTDVDTAFPLGEAGVYLVEVDTPSNYAGTPTSYSYGYVQQGQFLVRLTITNTAKADRAGLEVLMRRTLDRLR